MRLSDFLQQRRVLSAILGGLLLGAVAGLAQPIRASAPDGVDGGAWALPDGGTLVRFDETRFAKVRSARIWGGGASASGPGAAKAVKWQLTGIITRPAPVALVAVQQKRNITTTQVKHGGILPDGGKILEISDRAVSYERDGCKYERILYSPEQPAQTDGCEPTNQGGTPVRKTQDKHE